MLLLGNAIAADIQSEIKQTLATLSLPRKPGLAVVLVGTHGASQTYVGMKRAACERVGIESSLVQLEASTSEEQLLKTLMSLNSNETIDAILVQQPLPKHISPQRVIESIAPHKDVDGFHPLNMGKLFLGHSGGLIPCTPLGICLLLERYEIPVAGKHVVIVGRSNIVGKPLGMLLLRQDATITLAHSKTQDLARLTQIADILVSAVGKPAFITADMVREEAVVIDVGISRVSDASTPKGYRLAGDVDFEHVAPKCSAITPVPKGVGPLTVAMLLQNTLTCATQ